MTPRVCPPTPRRVSAMLSLASASMSTLRLPAGDLRMSMSDYFDIRTTNGESAFDRCYDPNWGCNWPGSFADEPRMTPGVTISVQTDCLLYTSPSPRDATLSRMPSSA